MIGLLISVISTLVVVQVLIGFEGQKRTVAAGSDAQINGMVGLYTLLRDVRQSGYAVNNLNLIGCDISLRADVTLTGLAPVTINHAAIPPGDANTDTLLLVYGNDANSPEGDGIVAQPSQDVYTVQTPSAFSIGDRVAVAREVAPGNPCGGLTLDTVTDISASNLTVDYGVANAVSSRIYNLGATPKVLVYAIRGGMLTLCDYMVNDCSTADPNDRDIWIPIMNNIVSLRAQYGRDTNAPSMDGSVDAYDQVTPASNCAWMRMSAMRFVLVARSGQLEKPTPRTPVVTTVNNLFWAATESDNPPGSASTPIDLTATTVPDGFTWQNFRYKVFETTVPILNIMLLGVRKEC